MPNSPNSPLGGPAVPNTYRRLTGSERRRGARSTALGPAEPAARLTLTLFLRRRLDGPPSPDLDYWRLTHPSERRYLSVDEYGLLYGASPDELKAVADFATAAGLTVEESHAARRWVIVSGSVAQINAAFAVAIGRYDSPLPRDRSRRVSRAATAGAVQGRQTHHSYEGHVHVPQALAGVVEAVLGLDDRKVVSKSLSLTNADPLPTTPVTAPLVCELYGWPYGSIPGQTVGIIAGTLSTEDITLYYENLNKSLYSQEQYPPGGFYVQGGETTYTAQQPPSGAVAGHLVAPTQAAGTLVFAWGSNQGVSDGETNLDVSLASSVAQGATIALYFQYGDTNSYTQAFANAIMPAAGQPKPSVVTSSYVAGYDAPLGTGEDQLTGMELWAISQTIAGAAAVGVTVCVASGDNGVSNGVPDGAAPGVCYVQYPASDPGVLAVGGTGIGAINGLTFDENLWSDQYGQTGGGVSGFFNSNNTAYPTARQPSWQANAGIPVSRNDGSIGRGVPDIAANAAPDGYYYYDNGIWAGAAGTSAAVQITGGLIAQLNAQVGYKVGFITSYFYAFDGSLCRKISNTPALNTVGNSYLTVTGPEGIGPPLNIATQGYPGETSGWDACTGWGVPDWKALVHTFTRPLKIPNEKHPPEKGYLEKAHLDAPWPPVVGGHGKPGDLSGLFDAGPSWLQDRDRLSRIEETISELTEEVRQLHAFIRPEERPPVGVAAGAGDATGAGDVDPDADG